MNKKNKRLKTFSEYWAISESVFARMVQEANETIGKKATLSYWDEEDEEDEKIKIEVKESTAIISIKGVITKEYDFWTWLFGGASTKRIKEEIQVALDRDDINQIILDIDTPGGTVDGLEELTEYIYANRGRGKIITYSDGMIASGGVWIGSASLKVYISGDTVEVGSIGVVATHIDLSKSEEKWGIKYTEVVAGKYKRELSIHKPLSKKGKEILQEEVDYIYGVFVRTIARNRGLDVDYVVENLADGRIYIGQQAIDNHLVDGFQTLDKLIQIGAKKMDISKESLKNEHHAIYQAIKEEGIAEGKNQATEEAKKEGFKDGFEAGKKAELERIKEVEEQLVPGYEVLIQELKFDGKTSGAEAAVKLVKQMKTEGKEIFDKLKVESTTIVPNPDEEPEVKKPAKKGKATTKTEEEIKKEWEASADLQTEFPDFKVFLAFENNKHKVRTYGTEK